MTKWWLLGGLALSLAYGGLIWSLIGQSKNDGRNEAQLACAETKIQATEKAIEVRNEANRSVRRIRTKVAMDSGYRDDIRTQFDGM